MSKSTSSTANPAPAKAAFTDKDTEKFVALLNFIATHAEFHKLTVQKCLEFTRLLNWAQTDLLPKIDAHKFEVLSVKEHKGK